MSEQSKLLSFFFEGGDKNLVNVKLFRGLRDLVSQDDLCAQVHSAFMQKRMGKAKVTTELDTGVRKVNVREFVASL